MEDENYHSYRARDRDSNRDYNRDRDYDRDRDVERMGRGESYRPGRSEQRGRDRTPIRERDRDSYRRPPPSDSYMPSRAGRPRSRSPRHSTSSYRRRSRSRSPPTRRYRDDSRDRAPSPRRRAYSPPPPPRRDDDKRDVRARSRSPLPRDSGRYERSPRSRFRERSPLPLKRARDPSPYRERGHRSPPKKRERYASPKRYERSRSPQRRLYSPPPRDDPSERSYRRRSPSPRPRRDDDRFEPRRPRSPSPRRPSGPPSVSTSRRSSPRRGFTDDRPSLRRDSPPYQSPRMTPEPRNGIPTGPSARNGAPTGPRAPPTGPSSSRSFASPVPPSGPRDFNARVNSISIMSAPSRPRGRGAFHSGPGRDFSGGIPAAPRRASDYSATSTLSPYPSGPPSGPRGTARPPPPFRGSSNSTSTTYPRTLRFQHQLADTNAIVPGGKKVDYRSPNHVARLRKLEEDIEKTKAEIADKERGASRVVSEWEQAGRDAQRAQTRAEMIEENITTIDRYDPEDDFADMQVQVERANDGPLEL